MHIRPFIASDASDLADIFHHAVHAISDHHYTAEQRRVWSPARATVADVLARVTDGRMVFVAEHSDQTVGFLELEQSGHIDCFYCHPDFANQGVGTALYQHVEQAAKSKGINTLVVHASEIAKAFFLKQGFGVDNRNDLTRKGVSLHNYTMSKRLA